MFSKAAALTYVLGLGAVVRNDFIIKVGRK